MLSHLAYPTRSDRLLAAIILIVGGGVLFWAGLQPELAPPGEFGADKFLHAGSFGLLALLGAISLPIRPAGLAGLCLSSLIGAALEVAQSYVPGRDSSVGDWLADTVGAALAIGLWWLLRQKLRRPQPA